jgi:hypothetical protein
MCAVSGRLRSVEPRAAAIRTRPVAEIFRQLLAHGERFGLAIAPFQVGQDALERMTLAGSLPLAFAVAEFHGLIATAIQQHLLHLGRQLGPRLLDVELVVAGEGLDELKVVGVTPVPAAHGAAGQ